MKQRLSAAITLFACCLFAIAQNLPAQGNTSMSTPATPDRALDTVAHNANPNNPDSITALAQSVVAYPHVYGFPSEVANFLVADLARSETAYRNGLGPGVKEEQVVTLMNNLAAQFHMPDYVRTTPGQVRNLRMRLAMNSPYFMGARLTSHSLQKGQSVNEVMSPLQAMHLVCVLVDQKVLNDLYQDPTIDIVSVEKERAASYSAQAASTGKKAIIVHHRNPHGLEVRNAISNGIASMSVSDAYDLITRSMATMGLK